MADLRTWARDFLRHKDVFAKRIVEMKDTDTGLHVVYKQGKDICVCTDDLGACIESSAQNTKIFVLNSRKNLEILLQNWSRLIKIQSLVIYFVNPDSSQEQKWIIQPYLHSKVADDDTLKEGLLSMFNTVDEVS